MAIKISRMTRKVSRRPGGRAVSGKSFCAGIDRRLLSEVRMKARTVMLLSKVVLTCALPAMAPSIPDAAQRIVQIKAAMKIDSDGLIADRKARERHRRRDRYHQDRTSLSYRSGRALDPNRVPYVVIPVNERNVSLGDYVVVSYRGKSILAIVGDRGPRFGEASIAVADALGVNSDGRVGGVDYGVSYSFFPGSGDSKPANESELLRLLHLKSGMFMAESSFSGSSVALLR